jgi:hypothetical protein
MILALKPDATQNRWNALLASTPVCMTNKNRHTATQKQKKTYHAHQKANEDMAQPIYLPFPCQSLSHCNASKDRFLFIFGQEHLSSQVPVCG